MLGEGSKDLDNGTNSINRTFMFISVESLNRQMCRLFGKIGDYGIFLTYQ